ncbi:3-isopropylmalate dehydrogenase [Sugiyamaella lignohabitans]|uniref:3-isopropylmalate dehydrogenase n=1 Tax=Sugiyamaella lignohabitans TaxID=796027 RepID=A0A167E5C3_9ASCO|nr:3-isopropylmalate dehydrogenase [Sugiyamaella lignohabitans]ANB13658.1 3-isopropylmalate dehydrogenase [Sugiyamaella lignohabitans]
MQYDLYKVTWLSILQKGVVKANTSPEISWSSSGIRMALKSYKVLVLPGDHVGPEIIDEAVKLIKIITEHEKVKNSLALQLDFDLFGGASIDKHNTPITKEVLAKARESDAVLFGAVGGPEWENHPSGVRAESAVLALRKELNCWANIRPCKIPSESLINLSALKPDLIRGTDFVVLRENCGGAYFGEKIETDDYAADTWGYKKSEVERITEMAVYLASKHNNRIISCDKANVLAVSRLWRRVVESVVAKYPHIQLSHQLADSATVIMMQKPTSLNGVLLCDNTFGDILSDQSAVIVGSLGLLPSASLSQVPGKVNHGDTTKPAHALYEPSHGSAPDLPKGAVNPVATILSGALMFRYSFDREDIAVIIEHAVKKVLDSKDQGGLEVRTRDLGGRASTSEVSDAICAQVKESLDRL